MHDLPAGVKKQAQPRVCFCQQAGAQHAAPLHALNDTFPIGTLRAMIADAGWQEEDLGRLGLTEES